MLEVITLDSEITINQLSESESISNNLLIGSNISANGDFESDTNAPPAQWTILGDGGTSMGAMADATAPSGNNSAWYTQTSTGTPFYNVAINNGSPDVVVGNKYRLSFWLKQCWFLNPIHIGCGSVFQEFTPTSEWIKYTIDIVALSTQKLRFYGTGAWVSIYIDNIVLQQVISDDSCFVLNSKVTKEFNKYSRVSQQLLLNSPLNSE